LLLLPGRVLSLQLLLSIESWFRCAEADQELLSRALCGIEARTGNCDNGFYTSNKATYEEKLAEH
jgi:hypothetical protein